MLMRRCTMRASPLTFCRSTYNVSIPRRTAMTTQPLVESAWLREQLQQPDSKVRVFDSSLDYTADTRQQYIRRHIPGASFFDLNEGIRPTQTIPRNLPEIVPFTDYARRLGINSDTHVVFYDFGSVHYATKAWWIFKTFGHKLVSVLNGGIRKWELDGNPVESGEETPVEKVGDFTVNLDMTMTIMYDDLVKNIREKSSQIVDTRRVGNFLGKEAEPSLTTQLVCYTMGLPVPEKMQTGHMPGAVHVDLADIIDNKTSCFHPKSQLLKLFHDRGLDLSRPLTSTCYLGHMATVINMAAYICGKYDTTLYYGSWTEYGQRAPDDLVTKPMKSSL